MDSFEREVERLIRARYLLTIVITPEEQRAVSILKNICEKEKGIKASLIGWDIASGFSVITTGNSEKKEANFPVDENQKDPLFALEDIDKCPEKAIFVLKDYHEFWDNPMVKRKLRNLSQVMVPNGKSIVVINPGKKIPDELKDEVGIVDLPMPREEELREVLNNVRQTIKNIRIELDEEQEQKLLQAALGLTGVQARRVFMKAAIRNGILDESQIKLITEEKRQVIRQSEALEFFPASESLADIGGLERLKEWLHLRQDAFSDEAREYKLPAPKGVALIGIPGTGKSLTAKAIGSIWRLPLLRLDTGALFGGIVGESEERTRRALDVASTIAPCILWIDEIEKAFAKGGLDGGTSERVFGSILTWMQEKTSPVFVVATANNISGLPPELLRKGRFDEVFFLDLPTEEERKQIFDVQLKKRERVAERFDLDLLASKSAAFTGAEIETAVQDAMFKAFADNRRELETDDIIEALKNLIPIAESQKESVAFLRKWLQEGRAISASYKGRKEALSKAPKMEELEIMYEGE